MIDETCPVHNEIMLLEFCVEAGLLAPRNKWKKVIDKISGHIQELELELAKFKSPNKKLTEFGVGGVKDG